MSGRDNVMRILRFVESECEVLPSKEKCPYLVVVEVVEQESNCKSDALYLQGVYICAYVVLYVYIYMYVCVYI